MKVLSPEQKSFYEEQGYLLVESFVDQAWLDRLNAAMITFIDKSRTLTE